MTGAVVTVVVRPPVGELVQATGAAIAGRFREVVTEEI